MFFTDCLQHKTVNKTTSDIPQQILANCRHISCRAFQLLTLIYSGWRGAGEQKSSPISFSYVTSTKVGIIHQNFLTFSCNTFATLMSNFKEFHTWCQSQIIELEPRAPLKKISFFRQTSPYKIEVMITSLTEMPELPNYGHMTTSAI